MVNPTAIHLDICSICQLDCPLCITKEGRSVIGSGSLKSEDFKRLVDQNPWIGKIEFANKGEIFLNKDLVQILRYAHERNVSTDMGHGVNLNHASEDMLEALVKYQVARLRVSIDGITQETYQTYRVGGNLARVIENIKKINDYKEKYQSSKPHLIFQFIVFGHNEHEIARVGLLARLLKMEMCFFLNRVPDELSVRDRTRVRQFVGYADRGESLLKEGKNYMRHKCYQMWIKPHINWDGKLLGCSSNVWGSYAGRVFDSDLGEQFNNEKMQYCRDMLMGKKPPREDIPCTKCVNYRDLLETGNWLTESEVYGSTRD
jgi:MoaA/NifB/PqqE/SkfB family radical SAM enzyme